MEGAIEAVAAADARLTLIRAFGLPGREQQLVLTTAGVVALGDLLAEPVLAALRRHHWPGNVRELRNFVEATLAMGEAPPLHAPLEADADDPFGAVLELPWKDARAQISELLERRYLAHLMTRCGGNVSEASRVARMDRGHLTDLLRRHGLK